MISVKAAGKDISKQTIIDKKPNQKAIANVGYIRQFHSSLASITALHTYIRNTSSSQSESSLSILLCLSGSMKLPLLLALLVLFFLPKNLLPPVRDE